MEPRLNRPRWQLPYTKLELWSWVVVFSHKVNLAVLHLREHGQLATLQKKWWQDKGECPSDDKKVSPSDTFVAVYRGATTFSKLGGPIPWSRLLYRTKYGWYTQFRALQPAAA